VADKPDSRKSRLMTGLSARLLILTMLFIMLAEALIWTPSISRFRKVYLEEHIVRAQLSTLALEAIPEDAVGPKLRDELLYHAEAYGIVLNRPDQRVLMVSKAMPPKVDLTVDLTKGRFPMWIFDAFETLAQDENRILRVIGMSPRDPDVVVEVVMDETPMREAMYGYSARIFNLSLVISLFTAGLVYLSLQWLMIRPMRRITESISAFRRAPEDATREIRPSGRDDEIGITERELANMQDEVRQALQQKTRLATLGAAVAKVNHDLRNSLAIAVLAYDKLAVIDDPEVKRTLPKMYDAIDRAVNLCSQTLNFVSDQTPHLQLQRFELKGLIGEVGAALDETEANGPDDSADSGFDLQNDVPAATEVTADREQLFRVFSNLAANAREAGARRARITAERRVGRIEIEVADDGPGLSEKAKAKLFEPFAGSAKSGGTGLGLVIVRDVIKAHGGDVRLLDAEEGAAFRVTLPLTRREA